MLSLVDSCIILTYCYCLMMSTYQCLGVRNSRERGTTFLQKSDWLETSYTLWRTHGITKGLFLQIYISNRLCIKKFIACIRFSPHGSKRRLFFFFLKHSYFQYRLYIMMKQLLHIRDFKKIICLKILLVHCDLNTFTIN